ncbi:MAG: hypothetical protein ABL931_14140 [Usitatibacteraceae bacterium]
MISFDFNGERQQVLSTERMGRLLDQFDQSPVFELWAFSSGGQSLCMLRNGDHAWLMYLRHEGDSGFSSRSGGNRPGVSNFKLSNGQINEYPLSWCIGVEQCYKVIAYFFENAGEKPDWITWHED